MGLVNWPESKEGAARGGGLGQRASKGQQTASFLRKWYTGALSKSDSQTAWTSSFQDGAQGTFSLLVLSELRLNCLGAGSCRVNAAWEGAHSAIMRNRGCSIWLKQHASPETRMWAVGAGAGASPAHPVSTWFPARALSWHTVIVELAIPGAALGAG